MKRFAKFIFFTILGWKIEGTFPKEIKKYIVIAAPHTSWLDFPIAIFTRLCTGVMIHFIGKSSLFKGPFGFIFKALGGTPVHRDKNNDTVKSIVTLFQSKKEFRLGLSPEGTRQKVSQWKTGFYYIAKGANVPIVMATLDFEFKKVKIAAPFYPTDHKEKDFEVFKAFYANVKGRNPELS